MGVVYVEQNIYKKMYFTLFNQITDAIEALESQNYGLAEEILRRAQQQANKKTLEPSGSGVKFLLLLSFPRLRGQLR